MKLSRDLKKKINRTAHAAGLEHAEKVKAEMTAGALAGLLTANEAFPTAMTSDEAFPTAQTSAEAFSALR